MTLNELVPNDEFLDGVTPTIDWDGRKWPIPLLAPRQQRQVIPAMMRSRNALLALGNKGGTAVSEAEFDDLYSVVFWGLKRAHPKLTKEQFDDVPLGLQELSASIQVIAVQTGMFGAGDGKSATMGEAQAASSPQTGT